MKVKIRTREFHFSMPLPVSMIGFAVKLIPAGAFDKLAVNTPEPYRCLVTKETVTMILEQCLDVLKENRGLEAVHVEARDGTFISIRL